MGSPASFLFACRGTSQYAIVFLAMVYFVFSKVMLIQPVPKMKPYGGHAVKMLAPR